MHVEGIRGGGLDWTRGVTAYQLDTDPLRRVEGQSIKARLFLTVFFACTLVSLSPARAAGDASWPVSGHDAQSSGFNPAEQLIGKSNVKLLRRSWNYHDAYRAVVSGGRVVVVAGNGLRNQRVVMLDAVTGRALRTIAATSLHLGSTDEITDLAFDAGKVVVATTGALIGIDSASGKVIWRDAGGATFLTAAGGVAYTGKGCQNPCGALASFAIEDQTGRIRWRHEGNFGGPPVLIGGHLYQSWGEYRGETRVYDPGSGGLIATMPLLASWTGNSTYTYADVFAGLGKPSWLGKIGASGRPGWRVKLGVVGGGNPVLAYGSVFLPSNRFHPGVIAVRARDGKVLWGADLGSNLSLAAANQLIYVLRQRSGRVNVLNASSGAQVATLQTPAYKAAGTGEVLVANGALYVVGGGSVSAFRLPS
jgi:PQQ-like domain